MTRALFIFGVGYTCERLANRMLANGWHVSGTRRNNDAATPLDITVWDGKSPIAVPDGADWIISIPPNETGCPVAQFAQGTPRAVIYLSTTGLYGDHGGDWVDEATPIAPLSKRAERRHLAESQWLERTTTLNKPLALARLPGIYGPGRSAFDRLRRGTARRIRRKGQVFSRIHVDDLAAGLEKMLLSGPHDGVFHFTDDMPAPASDVTAFAAQLLRMPAPPEIPIEDADLSPMAASFYAESKRISSMITRQMLGWQPVYKTYKDGLNTILEEESAP